MDKDQNDSELIDSILCQGCQDAGIISSEEEIHDVVHSVLEWFLTTIVLPNPDDSGENCISEASFRVELAPQASIDQIRSFGPGTSLSRLPSKRRGYGSTDFTKFCVCVTSDATDNPDEQYVLTVSENLPKPVVELALVAQLSKLSVVTGLTQGNPKLEGLPHAIAWVYAAYRKEGISREISELTPLEDRKYLQAQKDLFNHLSLRLRYSNHPIHGSATRKAVRLISVMGLRHVVAHAKATNDMP